MLTERAASRPGLGATDAGVRFLADFSIGRFPLEVIYRLLLAVPGSVTPPELLLPYPESHKQRAVSCFVPLVATAARSRAHSRQARVPSGSGR
jgi:hypothetical protein